MKNPFLARARRPSVTVYGPGLRAMHGRNLETGDEELVKKRLSWMQRVNKITEKSTVQIGEGE